MIFPSTEDNRQSGSQASGNRPRVYNLRAGNADPAVHGALVADLESGHPFGTPDMIAPNRDICHCSALGRLGHETPDP